MTAAEASITESALRGHIRFLADDLLEGDTAEPITTEDLRYGQRVKVMAVQVPDIMRTPEALAVWGPRHFGIEMDYQPMTVA